MSENLQLYNRALDGFDRVVRGVPADRWESQSPCTDWKAIDVAGHVIGIQMMVTGGLTGAPAPSERPSTRELAGDDPVSNWEAARGALEAAAAVDGALERTIETPFGAMPADTFLGILVLDALTHSWDLARAAGLDDALDPELVTICFERIRPLDAAIRRPGAFDGAKPAPEGADEQTRLMAFLGRQV